MWESELLGLARLSSRKSASQSDRQMGFGDPRKQPTAKAGPSQQGAVSRPQQAVFGSISLVCQAGYSENASSERLCRSNRRYRPKQNGV
jgi:hypothetical protein